MLNMRYLFIQGGLRRGAGASAALGSLWAAARRGSLQAQPSPAAGGAPRMAGRSQPPARSFSRPRRAAARRWPGSAGNALGGVPGGLTAPGHRAAPCTPRTAGSLHAACRPRRVRFMPLPLPGRSQSAEKPPQGAASWRAGKRAAPGIPIASSPQHRAADAQMWFCLARLRAHSPFCFSPACASGFAGSGSRSFSHLQRLNKQTFVLIIAQKKPGCATNTTGFGLRSGGFPPDVLSDSRYAMSGLHHYTGKFKQKVPAGPRKWACG